MYVSDKYPGCLFVLLLCHSISLLKPIW